MSKFKVYKLKNGLKILMCQDKNKHSVDMSLITFFGGSFNKFKVDDKIIKIPNGVAHFLEHYIIEFSKFGNAFTYFSQEKYASFNGYTGDTDTEFTLNTPHDYLDMLKDLLVVVNESEITEENIETNKPEIIEEINKSDDDKHRRFYFFTMNKLFKKLNLVSSLGLKEDIVNLTKEDVLVAYKTFYRPDNQVLCLAGNFEIDDVIKLVTEYYGEEKDKRKIKVYEPKLTEEIEDKEVKMYDKVHTDYLQLSYKINIKYLKEIDRIKLEKLYLGTFLDSNFGESSEIFQKLIDEKIIDFNISCSGEIEDNFLVIRIADYVNDRDKFISEINNVLSNILYDEEYFKIKKNMMTIDMILIEDNCFKKMNLQKDLYLNHNYKKNIKINDMFTFEEYKEIISKLDFNNYLISEMLPEETEIS